VISYLSVAAGQPSMIQVWGPAALAAVVSALAAVLVYRNSKRANVITERTSLSEQQLAWTKQAMAEAQEAKTEARAAVETAAHAEQSCRAAVAAADAATVRAEHAERRLTDVTELTDRLSDWIAEVVRQSHVDGIGAGASPQVKALLDAINGGPPEVSSLRARWRRG
jgi:multidrug efflux pump subunit AcrA (membrane-fusion protein)